MALSVTHTDSLDITVATQPPFPAVLGFSNLLLLEFEADNSSGQRAKEYTQSQLDQLETDWTTRIRDAAEAYFRQTPSPSKIVVGAWDKNGGETPAEALKAINNSTGNWFYIASTIRAGADQEEISEDVETFSKPSMYFLQSDDDLIATSNDLSSSGSALASVPGRERTIGLYHPGGNSTTANNISADASMAGMISPFDPDRTSRPFYGELKGVPKYDPSKLPAGASIGTAQTPGNVRDNGFNTILPFGSATSWIAPGQNANGRQGKVILTKFWFQNRLKASVANEIQTASARGKIIPVGAVGASETEGQARMAKLIEQRYAQGFRAGHFLDGNLDISYPQIQSSDVSNGIIPLEAEMTVALGGSAVTFNIFFSRESV